VKQFIGACILMSFLCFVPDWTSAQEIPVQDPGLLSLGIHYTDYMSDENSFSFLMLSKNKEKLGEVHYSGILETTQRYYVEWNHRVTYLEYNHEEGTIRMSDDQGNESTIIVDKPSQIEPSRDYQAMSADRRTEKYLMSAAMQMFAKMDDQGSLMENPKIQRGEGGVDDCIPLPYLVGGKRFCNTSKEVSIQQALTNTNGKCSNEYCWGCCIMGYVFTWQQIIIFPMSWWCTEAYGYPCDNPSNPM